MMYSLKTSLQNGVLALGLATLLFACSKEEIFETSESASSTEKIALTLRAAESSKLTTNGRIAGGVNVCGDATTVKLMAGQTIPVGDVSVYNDADNLYITVSIEGAHAKDWFIRKTHLFVGEQSATMGIKNPAPGKFPYSNDVISANNTGVQEYTYTVPAADLANWGQFDIAIHAEVARVATDAGGNIILDGNGMASVVQSEGAWGQGRKFSDLSNTKSSNWAMYFSYQLQTCNLKCNRSWFRIVSRNNNGEITEEFDFNEFDLVADKKVVGTATYRRDRTGGSGQNPVYAITIKFEITEAGYGFDEFSAIYKNTDMAGLSREDFEGSIRTEGEGGTITFQNITGGTYWLGLYSKISGSCK